MLLDSEISPVLRVYRKACLRQINFYLHDVHLSLITLALSTSTISYIKFIATLSIPVQFRFFLSFLQRRLNVNKVWNIICIMASTNDVTHMTGLGLLSNLNTASAERLFYYHRGIETADKTSKKAPILVLIHGYPQS